MKTFLANHRYINKHPKSSKYIDEITPLHDRDVPDKLFDDFKEDLTFYKPISDREKVRFVFGV